MRTDSRAWTAAMMLAGAMFAYGTTAHAEGGLTLEERVERLERQKEMAPAAAPAEPSGLGERIDALEASLKAGPFGLKIGGMIVTSYMWDTNRPESDIVSLRAFDKDHNSFSLDLFQLQVSREPGDNGVGFLTKVNFGKTAERMAADWDGDGTIGNVSEEQNSVELQDAFITWNPPGAPDFQIKAGKFVTLLGAEVIESPLNFNISRSLAFTFALPLTHTGVLSSYKCSDVFSLTMGVVNGWDTVIDSNDGKTFLGNLTLSPVPEFTLALNGIYGAEQADRSGSKRGVADVVATIKPVENLTLSLNYDFGSESDILDGNDTAYWNALSGIIAYDMPDLFVVPVGFALRGEIFDDSDGTRLAPPGGGYQQAWEVTATGKIMLAEGLMFRTEYRYDSARHDQYERRLVGDEVEGEGFNFRDDQHTIAAELSYVF